MFAFDLLLKLCFWEVYFIFAFDELNALTFCLLCRWYQGFHWGYYIWKKKWNYTWKHKKLCFSSKQGFEEKSITEHVIMEIIVSETLFDLLMRLLTVIEHFEDHGGKS